MVIESRTIVGGAAALAIVGIGLWVSSNMMSPPPAQRGTVEVQTVEERSWTVEVTEIAAGEKTASR